MLLSCDLRLVLCDVITRWPSRAGLGESQGRILILSLAKGTLLPVFNLLLWMLCCDEGSVISVLFETWLRILSKNLFHNHYLATCLPHQQWYCFVWTLNAFSEPLASGSRWRYTFDKIIVGAVEYTLVPFWLCNFLLEQAQRSCSATASN